MTNLVTVQVVIADDARALAILEYLRGAVASIAGPEQTDDAAKVRAKIEHTRSPLPADDVAFPDAGQLFDVATGEEVVGRAMTVPAISGFSTAYQGSAGIELRGEHLYEVFEERAVHEMAAGSSRPTYVTVTGRRIPEHQVILRTQAALTAEGA